MKLSIILHVHVIMYIYLFSLIIVNQLYWLPLVVFQCLSVSSKEGVFLCVPPLLLCQPNFHHFMCLLNNIIFISKTQNLLVSNNNRNNMQKVNEIVQEVQLLTLIWREEGSMWLAIWSYRIIIVNCMYMYMYESHSPKKCTQMYCTVQATKEFILVELNVLNLNWTTGVAYKKH